SSPGYRDARAWIDDYGFFYLTWEAVAARHEVVFLEFIDADESFTQHGVHYIFQRRGKGGLLFPFSLHRFIARQKPDVVVVHALLHPLQVLLLRRALGTTVRIVLQHHAEQPFHGWRALLQRMADRAINQYWFTAMGLANMWLQKRLIADARKVHEVMETTSVFGPVDRAEARVESGVQGERIYLWVGRLNDNKDPLLLVNAFLRFAQLQPTCRLYMIFGTDDLLPGVQNILRQHPDQAQCIQLIGKVPHHDLQHWYNSADFLVSCSHYEGSGVAVAEAMSCGCIPLFTDIPAFNYMTAKACGLSFTPGSEKELLKTLHKSVLLDMDRERGKTLAQFDRKLSAQAIAARIQDLLSP
ncbi:MAG: glycosyltransferase, partial [Sphingobacteriales bacterium]